MTPFQRECYIMAKPAGAACNLACHYCYYLEKGNYYRHLPQHLMSERTLEEYIKQYIAMQTTGHVLFTWHGGEPMLRPLDFYRKAIELQRKYANGLTVENSIQTNGLLLTHEWCRFLHDNQWLVGISIDGTQQMHDTYRRDRRGLPSWQRVVEAIGMMQSHGVEWNAMATIHQGNVHQPLEFYNFFKSIGCKYLQFTPIVESDGQNVLPSAVKPKEWGDFCCNLFDEWIKRDVGDIFVQLFDVTLANWLGVTPGLCTLAAECGHAGVIEANGDIYSCDHFVYPEHRLGNIATDSLINMMYGEQQTRFSAKKRLLLPNRCKQCRWLFACNGECPKNRFATSEDGEVGINYLCDGYRQFFAHVAPSMDIMADLYRRGLPPAEIMQMQSY